MCPELARSLRSSAGSRGCHRSQIANSADAANPTDALAVQPQSVMLAGCSRVLHSRSDSSEPNGGTSRAAAGTTRRGDPRSPRNQGTARQDGARDGAPSRAGNRVPLRSHRSAPGHDERDARGVRPRATRRGALQRPRHRLAAPDGNLDGPHPREMRDPPPARSSATNAGHRAGPRRHVLDLAGRTDGTSRSGCESATSRPGCARSTSSTPSRRRSRGS